MFDLDNQDKFLEFGRAVYAFTDVITKAVSRRYLLHGRVVLKK